MTRNVVDFSYLLHSNRFHRYQCYDATDLIHGGQANAVGVTLGNGQYRGPWTHAWSESMPPLAFTFAIRVAFTDGTVRLTFSSHSSCETPTDGSSTITVVVVVVPHHGTDVTTHSHVLSRTRW